MRDQNRKKRVPQVNEDDSSGPDTSVIRTHTPDAFENKRVWLELEHRVLAYHVVRMVVHSTNSKSSFRSKHINRTNILSLSFAALSPCKERRLFVTVLANLCLLIDDKHSIKGHPSFKNVWEVREEHPQALYDAAHSTKLPQDEIVRKINSVFQFFRTDTQAGSLSLEEGVRNESKQWWVIRARVFSIWLKDFTFSAEKLKEVSSLALEDLGIVSRLSREDDEVSIGAASSVGGVGQSEADGRMAAGNGCRLTTSGRHLRDLFFPCTGMASYEHLKDPNGDTMTRAEAGVLTDANYAAVGRCRPAEEVESGGVVDDENFDIAMRTISEQFGEKIYHRDTWEVALCKSKHLRELGKVDTFVRGVPLYDIDQSGRIVRKQPGRHSRWEVFMGEQHGREKQYALLPTTGQDMNNTKCLFHYTRNDDVLKFVAREAGCDELLCYTLAGGVGEFPSKIKFQTRSRVGTGLGDGGQIYQQNHPLPVATRMRHYCHEIAYFYNSIVSTTRNKRMRVLGNGNFGVPVEQCNQMKDVYGYPVLCEMLRRSLVELKFVGEGFE